MQIKLVKITYELDILKAFNEATNDDYVDCLASVGLLIHDSPLPDGFTVMLNYNLSTDAVTVYLENEETDFCAFIRSSDISMTPEEKKRIVKELSFI